MYCWSYGFFFFDLGIVFLYICCIYLFFCWDLWVVLGWIIWLVFRIGCDCVVLWWLK